MKPSLRSNMELLPKWLDQDGLELWAKSQTKKETSEPGESLAQHTQLVLARLAELMRLRPGLPAYLSTPRLWHCLFWACLLHDFGKAAQGFQNMLRQPDRRWQRRHEVLSLAFLDWVAPVFSADEQQWMLAAIASHHKDVQQILEDYLQHPDVVESMVAELSEPTVRSLWHGLSVCSDTWIEALDLAPFGVQPVKPMAEEEAVQLVCHAGQARIIHWLRAYEDCLEEWQRPRSAPLVPVLVMLRGLTTSADHAASAHLSEIPQGLRENWQELMKRVEAAFMKRQQEAEQENPKPFITHQHQQECAVHAHTSALLIAPTGSGKTEAALYWALGDGSQPAPRLFYALPYQASMNAMHKRLSEPPYFTDGVVGLQHGRAAQTIYKRLMDAEEGARSGAEEARWRLNLNKLHAYPVKVFSPYQMLKTLYQLRGFEGMLTDYTQAAFIFDEIHAYDANRLALILALIKHLRMHYGARFLLMSATFPALLQKLMPDILGIEQPIRAALPLFQAFRRHQLTLLDGNLLEQGLEPIIASVQQEKSVLVCCNTVQRAQDMRTALLGRLKPDQVELLHSRFTMEDRLEHEQRVMQRCPFGTTHRAVAVVATQVVEVSLNIDLDLIYTDPAPLDALIQRFGRVNRSLTKEIVPVHVFREPQDGQGIYQEHLVKRTLAVLEVHNGDEIDEAAIESWLNEIYNTPEIHDPWLKVYQQQFHIAEGLLRRLRPFNSDDDLEKDFEKLFDGVEVLPERFETRYRDLMNNSAFIEASQLFVPISYKRHQRLRAQGKIRMLDEKNAKRWIAMLPYDATLGLLFEPTDLPNDEF